MNIALIAHDAKKGTDGPVLHRLLRHPQPPQSVCNRHHRQAGLRRPPASRLPALWPAARAAIKQISSRISCNEIDLLLYFRNPIGAKATEPDEASLLRLCDVYNIPYATNIASAEATIHALENGDLDWRDIVNPKKSKNRFFTPPFRHGTGGLLLSRGHGAQPRRRKPPLRPKAAGTALWAVRATPRTCLQLGLPLFPQTCAKNKPQTGAIAATLPKEGRSTLWPSSPPAPAAPMIFSPPKLPAGSMSSVPCLHRRTVRLRRIRTPHLRAHRAVPAWGRRYHRCCQ